MKQKTKNISQKQQSKDKDKEQQITQTQILQMLHRKKMVLIQQAFQKKQKGLNIDQFIYVMLQHLQYDKNNDLLKKNLTLSLVDFFKQVDVNGDKTMQWQQFSNHIIELGLLRNDRGFKNVIKNYYPSQKIIDKQKHQLGIQSVYYFQKLKSIFLVQKQSPKFKVYLASNANLQYQVNAHKGHILDIQYLQKQNLIATSSNDLTINFWDAVSFTLKQIVSVPQIQLKIKYADWTQSNRQLLYTGGSDSIIHIYSADTLKQLGTISGWNPFYKSDLQQQGHCSPICDILPIPSQNTLASACLGGNICLWDANTHQLKKQLRGHNKGIYSLAWCQWSNTNQCLLSAGLDHQIFIWNTYVKDKIFMLRGHNHPLVGVKCLPDTPQIVTADISGMIKVWDVRNFLCSQTFNVPVQQLSSFCLTYSRNISQPMKKRIVCASKKMLFFQYDQPKDQFLTDQKHTIKVIYNSTLLLFLTLHPNSLKTWNALNGKLQSVYRGLNPIGTQLTTMILDRRQRKVFMGDSQGGIYTVNIKNGAKMKQFQRHNSMITQLASWTSESVQINDQRYSDLRRVISISRDPQVYIHDQDAPEDAKSSCRYVMKQHTKGCNSISIRPGHQLLASGSDDGTTIITNLISYRHQVMPGRSNQVKHVLFLDNQDILLSISNSGLLTFYGLGQAKYYKHKILLQKQYMTQSLTNVIQSFPVTSVKYYGQKYLLILGDQFGNIQSWSIQQIVKKIRTFKQQKTYSNVKQSHNNRRHSAFITSSFDCCCVIWSILDGSKIGSLLLGGDNSWGLKFDLTSRKKNAQNQVLQILNRIAKKNQKSSNRFNSKNTQEQSNEMSKNQKKQIQQYTQEQKKQYYQKFKSSLSKAKQLLDYHKSSNWAQQYPNYQKSNRLQKQLFDLQQDQNSFNVQNQVSVFKKNALQNKKTKNGKYY